MLAVVGLLVAVASGASAGTLSDDLEPTWSSERGWVHEQPWGDWCGFSDGSAEEHRRSQTYRADGRWKRWIDPATGDVHQVLEQTGTMTTAGVERPFTATLETSGPPFAYVVPERPDGSLQDMTTVDTWLLPRFWDRDLVANYTWEVEGFYRFTFARAAAGETADYGARFCG